MSKNINKYRKPNVPTKRNPAISLVSLSSYQTPEIIESKTNEWVEFGANNDYFSFLINKANGSATAGACIIGVSQMIFGKGLDATDSSRKPEAYARMISLFRKDVVRRLSYDLKLAGQCAMQVIYSKDKKTIEKIEHLPIETLRAEKCSSKDREVQAYYYHPDWANKKQSEDPLRIPAFGVSDTRKPIEILYVKPYEAGMYYYSTPDYVSGISYAEVEAELSTFHLNNVKNSMHPSMLISMNNGVPDEEAQRLIESKILSKFGGTSNAGKVIISFSDSKESSSEITPIQLSDAHNLYQQIADESQKKIMISHRIVSPMLLGIKDSTGFGNNAQELENASILMQNIVIAPFQDLLIDAFDRVLAFNGIALNLYFKTLQPLQFLDLENVKDKETREEETGVKLSKAFSDLEQYGEDEDLTNWELIDERQVDYDSEDELDDQVQELNTKKQSLLSKIYNFATTGTARPNAKSSQDGENAEGVKFKVRYQYAPLKPTKTKGKNVTRDFCSKMVSAKKIYRKEDIIMMGSKAVNPGWGLDGADKYSIWLFKGGGSCSHYWMRKTFMQKGKSIDINSPLVPTISVNKAKKEGFKPEINAKDVSKRPVDMPNNGFVNKR